MSTDPEPAQHETQPTPAPRRRRVLVVDDNEEAAEALALLLDLGGHDVATANEGRAALALAREMRPDTMLCDIDLPDMSGYDLARALRTDASVPPLYLVALSGYTRDRDRELALEAGFDVHLGKPVDPDRLEQMLAGDYPERR
jgi:CheY-like chemotaxis protein